MVRGFVFLVLVLTLSQCTNGGPVRGSPRQKLLLLLVDGFRWDYIDMDRSLTGFRRMEKKGVKADYVTPIFPSLSYPNWYSIVTGLYGESHGMVGNYMFDPDRKARFSMENTAPLEFWWNGAEPIWTTTQKLGLNTAALWWDGCQIPHNKVLPQICTAYKSAGGWKNLDKDTTSALMETLHRFERNETQIELVYYEKVDFTGHHSGVDSSEREHAVRSIDDIINKVLDTIDKLNLKDQVNLMVVSDHGMTDTSRFKMIDLSNAFDPNDILYIVTETAHVMIEPKVGREAKVYDDLQRANIEGVQLYKKENLPEMFHTKNNNRTLPIILVARMGYFFLTKYIFEVTPPGTTGRTLIGNHGWDPNTSADMRTIFYATGPAFKRGFKNPAIEMVDTYNVMCHALGIPANPNNGSWDRVKGMLSSDGAQRITEQRGNPNNAHTLESNILSLVFAGALIWTSNSIGKPVHLHF